MRSDEHKQADQSVSTLRSSKLSAGDGSLRKLEQYILRRVFLINDVTGKVLDLGNIDCAPFATLGGSKDVRHYMAIPVRHLLSYLYNLDSKEAVFHFRYSLEIYDIAEMRHKKSISLPEKITALQWNQAGKLSVFLEGNKKISFNLAQLTEQQSVEQPKPQPVKNSRCTKSSALYLGAMGLFAVATAYMAVANNPADSCATISCMLNGLQ